MSKNYVRDRKFLGLVEVINMLDDEQKATQKDVDEISHAFQWIGMDVKLPHLNLKDVELKSSIEKVKMNQRGGVLFAVLNVNVSRVKDYKMLSYRLYLVYNIKEFVQSKMSLNNREFLILKEIQGDRERWVGRRVSRHAYLRLGLG
jgi:hypothetical protein